MKSNGTFAVYLANYYINREGFVAGTAPEVAALAAACDFVLTRMDGFTAVRIMCIVDREAYPEKTFSLPKLELDAIGEACRKYEGNFNGQGTGVDLRIIEIGAGLGTEEDCQRLARFKRSSSKSKVDLTSWRFDITGRTVWTNAPLGGFLYGKRSIEKLLKAPLLSDAELRPQEISIAPFRFPATTLAMLLVLAVAYAFELMYGAGLADPSIQTLVTLGGLNRTLVLGGEWQRIFSAILLHGGIVHLLMNGFGFFVAGSALEGIVGRRWFFALFVICGVCGSLMSLAINPSTTLSVGASGAIMGLLTAAIACSFRYPDIVLRARIQKQMYLNLIPAGIPVFIFNAGHVDYACHLGGALGGALAGWVLLKTWRTDSQRPAFLSAAAIVCAAGIFAFALAAAAVVERNAQAEMNLAYMYYNGTGAPKDIAEAVKKFRKAANQGNAEAQYNLGGMHLHGEGVPKDSGEAVKWLRKAADQGFVEAQMTIGSMYALGNGVPKDSEEAVKWFRKAADHGIADAQLQLGFMCLNGEGLPKDSTEAAKWLRKAADQGLAVAQSQLGAMYGAGIGVPQDDAEAMKWTSKAADQGYPARDK